MSTHSRLWNLLFLLTGCIEFKLTMIKTEIELSPKFVSILDNANCTSIIISHCIWHKVKISVYCAVC